jgi:hypothetical protein
MQKRERMAHKSKTCCHRGSDIIMKSNSCIFRGLQIDITIMKASNTHKLRPLIVIAGFFFIFNTNVQSELFHPADSFKTYKKYKGQIGNKYSITMDLTTTGNSLEGNYYYDKNGISIPIDGSVTDSGKITIGAYTKESEEELNKHAEFGEKFVGNITSVNTIKGSWSITNNGSLIKSYPFKLAEIKNGIAPIEFAVYQHYDASNPVYIDQLKIKAADSIVNRRINRSIYNLLMTVIDSSIGLKYKTLPQMLKGLMKYAKKFESPGIRFSCNVKTNENNVLAIDIKYLLFTGGNPPATYNNYWINYDVTTGKKIELEELLVPGFEYTIDSLCNYNFNKYQLYDNFGITHEGLIFQFYDYQMGHGEPIILITYKEIESLIKKNGMLQRFCKSTNTNR